MLYSKICTNPGILKNWLFLSFLMGFTFLFKIIFVQLCTEKTRNNGFSKKTSKFQHNKQNRNRADLHKCRLFKIGRINYGENIGWGLICKCIKLLFLLHNTVKNNLYWRILLL